MFFTKAWESKLLLPNDISAIASSVKNYSEEKLLNVFLDFKNDKNQNILKQTIKYLILSGYLNSSLYWIIRFCVN